ncbi:uncharacterized protein LOC128327386 [Hemicordylus capensis]|uniref:uncharacterized protein LOC128327386 n=1 Tax=Hemicordylus capensis TaxID=884348 RepID=UPI0023033042|nr:uncharacterized protein LOC128327386 [Hemicordylus capensis]
MANKAAREGTGRWLEVIINASLREGRMPSCLKEAMLRPFVKKPSLDPSNLHNYRVVSNLLFLGKVIERVVISQLQKVLDDTDYLDPSQSGFHPGYGTETALVFLVDDLHQEPDSGSASLLDLLDLSATFDTVNHGILLDRLLSMGIGDLLGSAQPVCVLTCSHSFLFISRMCCTNFSTQLGCCNPADIEPLGQHGMLCGHLVPLLRE